MEPDVILLEQQSLEALRHNYPQLKELDGALTFYAEAEASQLTATAWHFTEQAQTLLRQSGLKSAILDLLDALVAERKQQRIRPNRAGRMHLKEGQLQLEWLHEESMPEVMLRQAV